MCKPNRPRDEPMTRPSAIAKSTTGVGASSAAARPLGREYGTLKRRAPNMNRREVYVIRVRCPYCGSPKHRIGRTTQLGDGRTMRDVLCRDEEFSQ